MTSTSPPPSSTKERRGRLLLQATGNALQREGMLEDAERAYRAALEFDSLNAGTWQSLGNVLSDQGCTNEAVHAYTTALQSGDYPPNAFHVVARALAGLGEETRSAEVIELLLERHPSDAVAQHMAAARCAQPPSRASDACMRQEFDGFARHFDETMEQLGYVAPRILCDALARRLPMPWSSALDLGCGTGLLGQRLRPRSGHLTGVDLSPGMLARAKERGVYDQLFEAEMSDFLVRADTYYDVIAAADAFIYLGGIEHVVRAAHAVLAPCGLLAFTVEDAADAHTHRLSSTGRYQHGRAYLEGVLADAGFGAVEIGTQTIRNEGGCAVSGLVVTAVAG